MTDERGGENVYDLFIDIQALAFDKPVASSRPEDDDDELEDIEETVASAAPVPKPAALI